MHNDSIVRHRLRGLLSIAVVTLLFAAPSFAGKKGDRANMAPQRLQAVTVNGETATLQLADGTSINVTASVLRIVDGRRLGSADSASANDAGPAIKRSKGRMSLSDLAALSQSTAALPAIVRVKYDKDGSIKRAKVHVFRSVTQADAFLEQSARLRKRAEGAPKKNH